MKNTCEKCSMDATFLKSDSENKIHYYCDHHAPEGSTRVANTPQPESGLKKFLPLIIIFSSIFIFTVATTLIRNSWGNALAQDSWDTVYFAMRMMVGSFFAIFGLFKIFNLSAFADAYMTYDIVAKRSRPYAFIYPFLEILIAVLYLTNTGGLYRDIFTFILMVVSTIGVVQKIRQKEEVPCACLGMVFKIPMTSVTLIEDIVMATEAFLMILMTVGRSLAYSDSTTTLVQTLKIHTTEEWVQFSELGHWIIGGFIGIVLFSGILDRFKIHSGVIFTKYFTPIILILLGLLLSVIDVIFHSLTSDPQAVWYLLTHISQFQQHFLIGIFLLIAGVAEWIRARGGKQWLSYIVPTVMFLIGVVFFFHQQLGMVVSVSDSMNWHMLLGSMLIIGSVFRVLDILFFEEKKAFFTIWIIAILIGTMMLTTHREPQGAYQLPLDNIISQ